MIRFASSLWWRRYISRNSIPWTELDAFPALTPAGQRRVLAERLLSQIRYFGARADALPEWRDAARITDPDELWRVWSSLPIVDKTSLQTRFVATETRNLCGLPGRLNSTGGSTGEAVHFYHDERMVRSTMATDFHTRLLMGWQPGMPTVIVWGSERDIKKQMRRKDRLNARLLNEYLVDGYSMSDATVDRVMRILRSHRGAALSGFTSMLQFVAERALERGIRLPPGGVRTAWNAGEMLFPEQVDTFWRAFGVPILNRYGGRELSAMAVQTQAGAPLRVLRPWLFLEIVDEAGRPAAAGEGGRLIWTSTICRGTPFLRFDVGDLGAASAASHTEAGIVALDELQGRFAGLLRLPGGKTISNLFWNHLFKDFHEVRQFQVVLRTDGGIRLRFRGNGFTPEREARLHDLLSSFLPGVPVSIAWVDRIPLTAQGKLVQVVRERG